MTRLIDLITQEARPALHAALLQQLRSLRHVRALEELQSALQAAYEMGERDGRARVSCWHCGVPLMDDRPHCHNCPEFDCYLEDCEAPGCREEAGR
jgi:uncharacterized protein with von Willebrand factor type A (vWA) domain